jgi:hypothetical protein
MNILNSLLPGSCLLHRTYPWQLQAPANPTGLGVATQPVPAAGIGDRIGHLVTLCWPAESHLSGTALTLIKQ